MDLPGVVDRAQVDLEFDARYREPLVKRLKHGTLREGRRVPAKMVLPVRIAGSTELVGNAEIEEVRWMRLRDVGTPEVMAAEYPSTLPELLRDLREFYPDLEDDSWVTFFRFRFEDELTD